MATLKVVAERLASIETKVDRILEDVHTLNETVHTGNGRESLVARVAKMEEGGNSRRFNTTTAISLLAVAVSLFSLIAQGIGP